MGRVDTKGKQIDNLENVASSDILAGYQPGNKEENPGGDSYYGFIDTEGNWYIQRVTTTDVDFVRGSSDFSTNWTNRNVLVYAKFDQVF